MTFDKNAVFFGGGLFWGVVVFHFTWLESEVTSDGWAGASDEEEEEEEEEEMEEEDDDDDDEDDEAEELEDTNRIRRRGVEVLRRLEEEGPTVAGRMGLMSSPSSACSKSFRCSKACFADKFIA
ncbi:MAG: hypothetical protein ACRCY0_02330 [Synechococcus elongatus]|uniref:hypothetical protein n=1 Tax=Synechococcus elongatus TaxID=32046 RepID=UPI003F329D47